MASARGNEVEEPIANVYDQQRRERIANNKRMLDSLIPSTSNGAQHRQTKKRTKKNYTSDAPNGGHNLRARSQRNGADRANEKIGENHDFQPIGDFLCDNDGIEFPNSSLQKKRKGRGITKLNDIFARAPGMPKIKIMVNEYGQPIGDDARRFSSAIGCHVRKKISVGCADWRLVDAEKKFEVWTDLKEIFDINDAAFNWFMSTAGIKWKEFKAKLKAHYFDDKVTDEQLREIYERVSDDDWTFLVNYWSLPETEAHAESAKVSRSKMRVLHSSGSKSFARSRHEMACKLGRPPRRDELFIKTHVRKNGMPSRNAGPIINKLKKVVEDRPELRQRTIQQGDAFAVACGEKEPRGRIRGLGLGPTPQDIGIPGMKSYTPTRLQMQALALKKAEREKESLQQRVAEMEEKMAENGELNSHNGSNLREHVSQRSENEAQDHHDGYIEEDQVSVHSDDERDEYLGDRHVVAPSAGISPGNVAPAVQFQQCSPIIATSPRNDDTSRFSHNGLVGKDVILYALLRSDPVAKGTIISTNPNSVLGGEALGNQYCEVVVNVVLKRDTILPRPYSDVETMADAHKMSIAWPYKRLKEASKSSRGTIGAPRSTRDFGPK